jgi:NADH-quinone oxidoreductase subunit G/NADP-reducing hydrogenase subunit HndD
MDFTINVNNTKLEASHGETILDVLNRNGIKVPTLCHIKDVFPTGACRMCVVEDADTGKLVTSCSYPVAPDMNIRTHSDKVVESRKTIVELLLSNHPDDCLYCVRNKNCELQDLSEELHITQRRIKGKKNDFHMDMSSASIVRDTDKCILCGRCVHVCDEVIGVHAIEYVNRGSNSKIGTTFNEGLNTSSCVNCGQCIMVCPTGALTEKNHFAQIQEALNDPKKTVIVQYAPSISVTLAEEFGMESGLDINGVMNSALRKIGFDRVFDSSFSADLTIMEEGSELIDRIQNGGVLPMITSCCPGWVKYAEEFEEPLLPNLSSCKSPQQMMGAMIKSFYAEKIDVKPEDIFSVAIMPCTAKKFEAQREEMTQKGISDVDAVMTTREFARFIKMYGIDIKNIRPELTDSPLGFRSTAGKLFGASGGVMEAAIRTAHWAITGEEKVDFQIPELRGADGHKEAKIQIGDLTLGVAVVNGLENAKKLLKEVREGRDDIHFIEVMACPGGCVGGGGQPIAVSEEDIRNRMKALYAIDAKERIKMSHKNPEIQELYKSFLGKPLGEKSHHLLHTTYKKRDVMV